MKQLTMRSVVVLAVVAATVLALAQLGSAGTERKTAVVPKLNVQGGEFFFKLKQKSIAKPGKVTFVFKNVGHLAHDLRIDGKTTRLLQPGKGATLAVTFKKKGRYAYLCTVPGHAAAGMKGVFVVR